MIIITSYFVFVDLTNYSFDYGFDSDVAGSQCPEEAGSSSGGVL